MMEICPKAPKCPLFNDGLLQRQESADIYKKMFCKSDTRFKECKRYLVSEKAGKCPPYVLPNSALTIDDVLTRMKKEGMI
ncbi:MAG: hypothetical protein WCX31_06140 [Salinivirgaceae bacterium]